MKAIISHDVDQLTVWEHRRDLIIPKFIARSTVQLISRRISSREYRLRFAGLLRNKLQNICELMDFNKKHKVPATFFIGVDNALGLSYSHKQAQTWIKQILNEGFDVGVHGLAYDNVERMKREYEIFKRLSGLDWFGIRMHYLRRDADTVELLAEIGYGFDSTVYGLAEPWQVGTMIEFPLYLMDTRLIHPNGWLKPLSLLQAQAETRRIIDEVDKRNLKFLTILFHDDFYCDGFSLWKEWYHWVVLYLIENGIGFVSYRAALDELGMVDVSKSK